MHSTFANFNAQNHMFAGNQRRPSPEIHIYDYADVEIFHPHSQGGALPAREHPPLFSDPGLEFAGIDGSVTHGVKLQPLRRF